MILNILKIKDTEGEISSITGLGTTTALTTVEIKVPNVIDLVKKKIYIYIYTYMMQI